MTQNSHWPFGGDPWEHGKRADRQSEGERSQAADQAAIRQRRNDRLIVGGRAHVKKSGLS